MDFNLDPGQQALQDRARKLAEEYVAPRAAKWDETEEYPWENVEQLTTAGMMGMTIPEEYGGAGRSIFDAIVVVEEMAKVCGITARIVVEGNMGALGVLLKFGSEELKRRYLPYVLEGDKPAIAISEAEAGSDATAMQTRGVIENGEIVLDGSKCWITGGGVSRINLVFARIVENGEEQGIGGVLVERGTKGFTVGRRAYMMGLRGIPETELHFENCRVPKDNLLTVGFRNLMSAYNSQRVGAGTVALGLAQGAYEQALTYAKERKQFGRAIGEFQGLRWMLADSRIALDAARLLLYRAATELDPETGYPDKELAAIAKVFASEAAIKITNDALQVFGARGYSRDFPLERMARDARMFTIGGGTAQALRNVIGDSILGHKVSQRKEG
ncbi:MAG: acyl-CoA dehydrogenase family protein [SAR324 cluster bacterium]|nr:acyl-CoA dehydrogenase family protein [SAR324 cluster bacterium]